MRRCYLLAYGSLYLRWGFAPTRPLRRARAVAPSLGGQVRGLRPSPKLAPGSLAPLSGALPGLTPLASTERRAPVGFDVRVAQLKGKRFVRRHRISTAVLAHRPLIDAFVALRGGWGEKGHRSLRLTRRDGWGVFKKAPPASEALRGMALWGHVVGSARVARGGKVAALVHTLTQLPRDPHTFPVEIDLSELQVGLSPTPTFEVGLTSLQALGPWGAGRGTSYGPILARQPPHPCRWSWLWL